MPRLVRLDATGPIKIEPASFPRDEQGNLKHISICVCGLSQRLPFCDGAHKNARAVEQPGRLYVYCKERKNIVEERVDE